MTKHTRSIELTDATPVEDRRVTMAVSSNVPVARGQFDEVLVHSPEAIDLDFLGSGRAPVLLDHDPKRQVGVVEAVSLDAARGILRATVRFGKNPQSEEVLQDIRDGIKLNVSIGYSIKEAREDDQTVMVHKWHPMEVSIVAIPADQTIGVGRSSEPNLVHSKTRYVDMTNQTLTPRDAANIMDLGHRYQLPEMANEAIENSTPLVEFRSLMLDKISERNTPLASAPIGDTVETREDFSLGRFLRAKVSNDWTGAELERDVSQEMTRQQRGNRGSLVPVDALGTRSAMLTSSAAGPLTTTEHRDDLFINALRPASVAVQAGATVLSGLQSDISIPRETAAPTASWIAEGGSISEGNPSYDNVTLGATMLAARVSFSRKALLQSLPTVDALVKRSINRQFGTALDAAVLNGSGSGAVPTGIENVTGINSFAAFATGQVGWTEVVSAWRRVMEDDVAPDGTMAWITHPTVAAILRTTIKDAGSGDFIMGDTTELRDGSTIAGQMMGAPAFETSHATSSVLMLGRFSDVLIGQFGGVDFVVDEYSGASTGTIEIYAYAWFDINVRYAPAFCTLTGI